LHARQAKRLNQTAQAHIQKHYSLSIFGRFEQKTTKPAAISFTVLTKNCHLLYLPVI
jgi:hypothetical protein